MTSNPNVSPAMATAINRVLAVISNTEFNLNLTLTSANDAAFVYNPIFVENMTIITKDENIQKYNIKTNW